MQTITQRDLILPKIKGKWERILQLIEQLTFCLTEENEVQESHHWSLDPVATFSSSAKGISEHQGLFHFTNDN